MKNKRQNKIMEIVETYDVETQEELIEKLTEAGFNVTQATISRDIRELKLIKVMSEYGGYKYTLPSSERGEGRHIYASAVTESVRSVEYAGNIVVVKTYPGMANAVAEGIDSLHESDIIGCVAGDNTIIAVVRDEAQADYITKKLSRIAGV
jgi:transcriptional regulator of arginine metabolism